MREARQALQVITPLLVGIFPYGVGYGVSMVANGWGAFQVLFASATMFSGVAQFGAIELMKTEATQPELEAHPAWRAFGAAAERHPPMRGWLAVPLTTAAGRNVGLVQLSDRYAGEFSDADEATMIRLGQAASRAIARVRSRARADRRAGRATG